jgi:hypothetical protein
MAEIGPVGLLVQLEASCRHRNRTLWVNEVLVSYLFDGNQRKILCKAAKCTPMEVESETEPGSFSSWPSESSPGVCSFRRSARALRRCEAFGASSNTLEKLYKIEEKERSETLGRESRRESFIYRGILTLDETLDKNYVG